MIFDCDGVLLDSRAANIAYYNAIRASLGMPNLTPDEENFVHMATVDQAIFHIIPEHMRNSAETARAMMRYNLDVGPMLALERYLPEFLRWISPYKLRMGICTNRIDPVDDLLGPFNILPYFHSVKTAADYAPKPEPDSLLATLEDWDLAPDDVVYIGDSKVDELASARAGIPFWAFKNKNLNGSMHISDYRDMAEKLRKLLAAN